MNEEMQSLLDEFTGLKPANVLMNMVVGMLWYILRALVEKNIITKADLIQMKVNVREIALEAYKDLSGGKNV